MEVIIKDKNIDIESGYIYGLIMDEPLNKTTNTLINSDYYQDISLNDANEIKLGELIGVKEVNSFTNNKRKLLARILTTKSDYIIIENFFANFTYVDQNAFIKLFRNIVKKYHKTIIIKENDMDFLLNNCDYLINYEDLKIVNKNEYYLINYASFDKPSILEFTNLALEKNINLKYFSNRLDLLKALYRLVK